MFYSTIVGINLIIPKVLGVVEKGGNACERRVLGLSF